MNFFLAGLSLGRLGRRAGDGISDTAWDDAVGRPAPGRAEHTAAARQLACKAQAALLHPSPWMGHRKRKPYLTGSNGGEIR